VLATVIVLKRQGSKRHHLDDERTFVERHIRLESDVLFGGKIRLRDPSGKAEFVGVWGVRR
jgi:hypothetical protein